MGQIHVEVSPQFNNIKGSIRSFSSFVASSGERIIDKKQMTGRAIEETVVGHKKSSIISKVKEYKEDETFLIKKDDRTYIVQPPQGSYVSLEEQFYKRMLKTFNSDTNNIYIWLYRRYHYLRSQGKRCLFSKGQIVTEALGQFDNNNNRQKVETALTQLCLNGLISYNIVRRGQTFLRELTFIGQRFIVVDAVEAHIDSIIGRNELSSGDVEDSEWTNVSSIGLAPSKLEELSSSNVFLIEA